MLLNAAKCQGNNLCRFWVTKKTPTGGGERITPPRLRLGLNWNAYKIKFFYRNPHSKYANYMQVLVFSRVCCTKVIVLQITFCWFHNLKKKPPRGILIKRCSFLWPNYVHIFIVFLVWEEQLKIMRQCFFVAVL